MQQVEEIRQLCWAQIIVLVMVGARPSDSRRGPTFSRWPPCLVSGKRSRANVANVARLVAKYVEVAGQFLQQIRLALVVKG